MAIKSNFFHLASSLEHLMLQITILMFCLSQDLDQSRDAGQASILVFFPFVLSLSLSFTHSYSYKNHPQAEDSQISLPRLKYILLIYIWFWNWLYIRITKEI